MPKKTRAVPRPPLLDQLVTGSFRKTAGIARKFYMRFLRKTTENRTDAIRNRLSKAL